jgi:ribose-phosphate pyrophosphokinase
MEWAQPLLDGNRRALARVLTYVENEREGVADILAALYPHSGKAQIIGVTGAPGTGKSTLVTALAQAYRGQNQTVGILAVDPTSPFTGGALLGDRIRMNALAGDDGVFIRSMATRGSLGGLARAAWDAIRVLDAAGLNIILVETVGAGQSEVDIARAAQTTIVVEAPGLGDDVQAIKAGLLEIADILVVNKADRPGLERTVQALRSMLESGHRRSSFFHHHGEGHPGEIEPVETWIPPIIQTIASEAQGIDELVRAIAAHQQHLAGEQLGSRQEHVQIRIELQHRLRDALLQRLQQTVPAALLTDMVRQVQARQITPQRAVEIILHENDRPGGSVNTMDGQLQKVPGTKYYRTQESYGEIANASPYGRAMLFCGHSTWDLGREIAEYMGVKPGEYTRTVFSNENIFIQLQESVRGQDVYLVHTMASPIHDNLMEMLIMVDTLKRDSAARINVVIPYLSYARSDKKDQPRVGITARLIANMIEVAGADRYITIDLHAGQIQGFFNIPGDALMAFHLLSDYILEKKIEDLTVVSADLGFVKKGRNWAEKLHRPHAIVEKRRVDNAERPQVMSIIGAESVKGHNVLLVDDEVLTGGSVVKAVDVLRDNGARDIYVAFSHALLAPVAIERLAALDLKEIIFTNTVPVPPEKRLPNMTVLSVAPMLGEVIMRSHLGLSVGELFNE